MKEEQIITLEVPQREGKEGYIGTFFALFLRLGTMIGDANLKDTDNRIRNMTNMMISLIPGKKRRSAIRKEMNAEIENRIKGITGNEEKARVRNDVCIEFMGNVTDFIDLHIGVDIENRIGFSGDWGKNKSDMPKKEEDEEDGII